MRKKMADDNRPLEYMRYAIGEVLLVVLGILIALHINNLNENRKSDEIRKNYYNQILQDLEKDTSYIHRIIEDLDANILLYKNYLDEYNKQESLIDLLFSQAKLDNTFTYLHFNTNTIETLQTTGDIALMPVEIRNQLIDLKNSQEIRITVSSGNNAIYLKDLMGAANLGYAPNVMENATNQKNLLFNMLKVEDNLSQIALTVNGAFSLKNFTEKEELRSLTSMLEDIDSLSKLINGELENYKRP